MSKGLPSREQAIRLLYDSGCSSRVIRHCEAVADLAVETAETLKKKGISVDVDLVEVGALLHDIGRSKTHGVNHVLVGVKIVEQAGLPASVISIVNRHVGGGITAEEARELGWPVDGVYIPFTLEEKIVSYADKLIESGKRVPIDRALEQLFEEGKPEAANRVLRLHQEIDKLVGSQP